MKIRLYATYEGCPCGDEDKHAEERMAESYEEAHMMLTATLAGLATLEHPLEETKKVAITVVAEVLQEDVHAGSGANGSN